MHQQEAISNHRVFLHDFRPILLPTSARVQNWCCKLLLLLLLVYKRPHGIRRRKDQTTEVFYTMRRAKEPQFYNFTSSLLTGVKQKEGRTKVTFASIKSACVMLKFLSLFHFVHHRAEKKKIKKLNCQGFLPHQSDMEM